MTANCSRLARCDSRHSIGLNFGLVLVTLKGLRGRERLISCCKK